MYATTSLKRDIINWDKVKMKGENLNDALM